MTKLEGDPIGVVGAIIDAVPSGNVLGEKVVPDPLSSSTPSAATPEAPDSVQWTLQRVCDHEDMVQNSRDFRFITVFWI